MTSGRRRVPAPPSRQRQRAALLAYVRRDRDSVDQAKASHWARAYQAHGPAAALAAAAGLGQHALAFASAQSVREERNRDLAAHIQYRQALDRANARRLHAETKRPPRYRHR